MRLQVSKGVSDYPEGKIYDQTGELVLGHINSFIQTYQIPMGELLVQDVKEYPVSHNPQAPEYNRHVTSRR